MPSALKEPFGDRRGWVGVLIDPEVGEFMAAFIASVAEGRVIEKGWEFWYCVAGGFDVGELVDGEGFAMVDDRRTIYSGRPVV